MVSSECPGIAARRGYLLIGMVPAPSDVWVHNDPDYQRMAYNAGYMTAWAVLFFVIAWVRRALWISTLLAVLLSINISLFVLSLLGAFPIFRVELLGVVFLGIGFAAFIPHTATALIFRLIGKKAKSAASP
jgi:hypothetical protein